MVNCKLHTVYFISLKTSAFSLSRLFVTVSPFNLPLLISLENIGSLIIGLSIVNVTVLQISAVGGLLR